MKKILSIIYLIASVNSYSQIDHITIFLGLDELSVSKYFDSLNNESTVHDAQILKTIGQDGSLILEINFPVAEHSFYNCWNIISKFQRADGKEYCTQEIITGATSDMVSNINYLKDNFTKIDSNKWEKIYRENTEIKLKILAELIIKNNSNPQECFIRYELVYK